MIKKTPQEIADFFQCYVAQDKNGTWCLFEDKPEIDEDVAIWLLPQKGNAGLLVKSCVNPQKDHHWTHLYEPRLSTKSENSVLDTQKLAETAVNSVITSETGTNQQGEASAKSAEISSNYQKEADSDNKPDSYYQDSPKVDNKPEYNVVQGTTIPSLCGKMSLRMTKGWKPQGGIFFDDGLYYQAVVRGV